MNNVFNKAQILKSSEDCYKFSKSVSYETLVGGTTTGRECGEALEIEGVITRRTLVRRGYLPEQGTHAVEKLLRHVITRRTSVRRGYLPEQGTHANEESLYASVTCFMRLPRRIQRMLLLMTIPALALIFTLFATGESRADDVIPTSGKCNSAGTCLWSLGSAGTLTISAKDGAEDVKMANYNCEGSPCDQSTLISRPWEASLQQIKNVVIGDNITCIGNDAFQNASNLTSVTGMKDVKTIGEEGVFCYTGLTSITIPEGVTRIGTSAFSDASSLTSITIPEGVTSIGNGAFWNASSLKSITIPEGVTSIGNWAFGGASSLTSITIPEGVTSIGDEVFYNATGLTSITIPESVTRIGERAFAGASSLENIIISDNINTKNWNSGLPANAKIVCQGDVEKCKKALAKFGNLIVAADESQCTSTNYYWSGSSCNNKKNGIICAEKWKRNEDFCNRIQYTPAEAAKVLTDDNNNSVTITFKK